ncbi:MAG: integrase [Alcaligenaceae bacterium]|nr:MAG: integrase [Alcaligenaceae bacterium]
MKRTPMASTTRRASFTSDRRVKTYLSNSLAPSTISSYLSDLRHFKGWGGRVPSTPEMVARYLAESAGTYKASTLARRLAAIAHAHVLIGRKSPVGSEVVRRTMRGISRVHGASTKQAKPLTLQALRVLLRRRSDVSPLRDLRDRALLLLGFAGGFRRSELVTLRPVDLELRLEGLLISVRRSKTDQYGKGRVVAVPSGRGVLCPVKVVLRWVHALRKLDPEGASKPLFRALDQHGNIGQRLTAQSVGLILKRRLSLCGEDSAGVSSHSLRAGLVTASAAAGTPTWAIQRQTGHRSAKSVHEYVRGLGPFHLNAYGALNHSGQARQPSRTSAPHDVLTFTIGS